VVGMSGTGKSTAMQVLGERGHRVVDTDTGQWSHWVRLPDGSTDWVWREDAITALLADHRQGALFVAGCKKKPEEQALILQHLAEIEPRLQATATMPLATV
jgi:hypothetical protein